jgi:hypothetical protein
MFNFKINQNYAFEFYGLYPIRDIKDGISFFEFRMNLDLYKGDHNPRFEFSLILLNVMVFSLMIYNVNHK